VDIATAKQPVNQNVKLPTYCSVLPLTCSIHWLGFLDRYNTSIFSVLIFIATCSHTTAN